MRRWGAGRFYMPHMVTVDPAGNVWVADVGAHQVHKFTPDGQLLLSVGRALEPGSGKDRLCKPSQVRRKALAGCSHQHAGGVVGGASTCARRQLPARWASWPAMEAGDGSWSRLSPPPASSPPARSRSCVTGRSSCLTATATAAPRASRPPAPSFRSTAPRPASGRWWSCTASRRTSAPSGSTWLTARTGAWLCWTSTPRS